MTVAGIQADLQRETLEVLGQLLPTGASVALLDFPLHRNAGDSLIYLGERAYLRQLGVHVRYQTSSGRYRRADLEAMHPHGPILLHGGGNFGDRWEIHQRFRERVIADFPERPIVQLPQSIEMGASTAARVLSAYLEHPSLTVLLRDSRSMAMASDLLPGVDLRYCPDLAFGYSATRRKTPLVDVLELRRGDSESTGAQLIALGEDWSRRTTDWSYSAVESLAWKLTKVPGSAARRVPTSMPRFYRSLVDPSYLLAARILVGAAERTLLGGRVVVTDRLHAAILATLLGRPVVARDNANGKLAAAFEDYLGRFAAARFVRNPDEAAVQVRQLLRGGR